MCGLHYTHTCHSAQGFLWRQIPRCLRIHDRNQPVYLSWRTWAIAGGSIACDCSSVEDRDIVVCGHGGNIAMPNNIDVRLCGDGGVHVWLQGARRRGGGGGDDKVRIMTDSGVCKFE